MSSVPLLFVRNMFNRIREQIASTARISALQKKNPTCNIYPGVYIDDTSVLGKYNVIFNNVSIIASKIGDHTFIQRNSIISSCNIGKFCSIAMEVNLGLAQHAVSHVSTHPAFYLVSSPIVQKFSVADSFLPFEQTNIGHDVWIGHNAMIKGGVVIGNGAVVAAGAVVTNDVPSYAIVAGVPAKVIKYRFKEDIQKKLLELQWWDMPTEWLRKHHTLFSDPIKFIEFCKKARANNSQTCHGG
jgi:acetyltransferase-like isoleucine patch superfamily enzyme